MRSRTWVIELHNADEMKTEISDDLEYLELSDDLEYLELEYLDLLLEYEFEL
jgi:hypothetical protein